MTGAFGTLDAAPRGGDQLRVTDLMTTILQQEAVQTPVDSTTINENLVVVDEALALADTVSATAGTRPYKYGPTTPQPRYGFAICS